MRQPAALLAAILLAFAANPVPARDVLLVGNKADDTVWRLSLDDGRRTGELASGTGPHEIAVSPDGRVAVVTDYGHAEPGHSLTLVDVAAGTAAATIKIPGAHRFERRVLETAVNGKQLAVELSPQTDWMLAALLVFPCDEGSKVREKLLDALEKEIYFLPPDVAEQWKETRHEDDRPLPEFSDADRRRGFAVFARHWSEVL